MTTLVIERICKPTRELLKLKEENLKLKQKLEAIRTTVVDIFDRKTKDYESALYYETLIRIDKTIRECGQ